VVPFGAQTEILQDVPANVFPGERFKFHHLTAEGVHGVTTWPEAPASAAMAQDR
jgi:hypothetical protein